MIWLAFAVLTLLFLWMSFATWYNAKEGAMNWRGSKVELLLWTFITSLLFVVFIALMTKGLKGI